jgi:adenylate cyclase
MDIEVGRPVTERRVRRRLTAIMAADVVGYSRLMGQNELGTLAQLKECRSEVINPSLSRFGGRIVKVMGDGLLVEFSSVVDAVESALDFQAAMAKRNDGIPPTNRMSLRVGVHLGDVIVEDDDIYGDGVNVAARLEGLSEAGGICVSEDVYRQVRGKVDVDFNDLGSQTVKNIAEPVRAFRIAIASRSRAMAWSDTGPTLPATDKPSIAVLPFVNISGDTTQEYFADGMTEDIITSLSKLSQLMVIARNSSFTYKGRAVRVQQLAQELGVAYVIEGSVRKAINRVRITAQLIDCARGTHLWAERYDRELTDLFAIQDEVTGEIVRAMALTLTSDEHRRLARKEPTNLEAYDCLLRAREQWWRLTREGTKSAEAMLQRAITLDPDFSTPYAWLSYVRVQEYINGWRIESDDPLTQCRDLAKKAVALDQTDPDAHNALACAYLWLRHHDMAIAQYNHTIALDPNNARAHVEIGWVLHYAGRSAEALEPITRGMRLDPQYPDAYLHILAQVHFRLHRFGDATALLKRRIIRKPDTDISRVLLAATYGYVGRVDDAKVQWADALAANPNFSLQQREQVLPYKDPADFQQIVEGLRKAGISV